MKVDPTGKAAGRGAYLHNKRSCWDAGLKGALAHALKTDLTDQDRQLLLAYMANLAEEIPGEMGTATANNSLDGMAEMTE